MTSNLKPIPFEEFDLNVCRVWSRDWLLLSVGDFDDQKYNCMTVGWGMFGVMWGKPAALAVVRPQRWSMEFLEEFDTFTLCAFDETHRDALRYCGAHSGRDGDKFAAAGLTPVAAARVGAPAVAEAKLCVECRILYIDRFRAKQFRVKSLVPEVYPGEDYHQTIVGEIVRVAGTDEFRRR